jgi:flagellar assembly protein FliH
MTVYRSRSNSAQLPVIGPVGEGERARADFERLVAQAREEGRQAGLREAAAQLAEAQRLREGIDQAMAAQKAALDARLTPVFTALSASFTDLENLEAQIIQGAEAEMVRLAVAVAERVLRKQVEVDPAWMRALLAEALTRIPDKRQVVIRMHPEDGRLAREHLTALTGADPSLGNLQVMDDAGVGRGGCILQSLGTTLDAGVANAASRLGERLLQAAPKPEGWVAVGTAAQPQEGEGQ